MTNTMFKTQECSNQNTGFLSGKNHTPPEAKAIKQTLPQTKPNQIKRQTQSKMPTPPEVKNTKFYQMSLDKPRPLNQHNKKKVDHQRNSSQGMGRNHPTEGHVYMGNKHHDEANMGHNQSIDIRHFSLFWTKTI
jgi:hypothetical protein